MNDQKPDSIWYAPPIPWWYSGLKVAALVLLLNAIALEWAIILGRVDNGLPTVLVILSIITASLLASGSTTKARDGK